VIPGDTSSPKIYLTKEELYGLEKTLSKEACEYYQADDNSAKAQRSIAKLISISYHCLGGNDPCQLSHKRRKIKGLSNTLLPHQYRFDYLSFFIEELMKMMVKFDRSKGCWTQYVRWARGKGLRRTFQVMKAEEKSEELLSLLKTTVEMFGTCCTIDSYLGLSKENDSVFEESDEEFKENTTNLDGCVGE
jgi:hypothetical protein